MNNKEVEEILEKGGEIRIDINIDGRYVTTAVIRKNDHQEEQEDDE